MGVDTNGRRSQYVLEVLVLNNSLDPEWDPEPVLAGPGRLNLYRRVEL